MMEMSEERKEELADKLGIIIYVLNDGLQLQVPEMPDEERAQIITGMMHFMCNDVQAGELDAVAPVFAKIAEEGGDETGA